MTILVKGWKSGLCTGASKCDGGIILYMQNKDEFNFDLPAVEAAAVTKPRIHFAGESTCVSCEG